MADHNDIAMIVRKIKFVAYFSEIKAEGDDDDDHDEDPDEDNYEDDDHRPADVSQAKAEVTECETQLDREVGRTSKIGTNNWDAKMPKTQIID